MLIKLTKTKHNEKILKATREKQQVTYKGNPICLTADLSAETLQTRREWQDIFKVLKGKGLQPRLLYSARISFKIDEEIKSFSDKQKLREFSTTKPALQQMLNGVSQKIQQKKKDLQNQPQTSRKKKQQVIYKGTPICLTADLSAEALQARREWQDIFKVLKGKKSTTKITVPGKDLIQN